MLSTALTGRRGYGVDDLVENHGVPPGYDRQQATITWCI
jgi:hypothetical protein